jgi:hypothetical protein
LLWTIIAAAHGVTQKGTKTNASHGGHHTALALTDLIAKRPAKACTEQRANQAAIGFGVRGHGGQRTNAKQGRNKKFTGNGTQHSCPPGVKENNAASV